MSVQADSEMQQVSDPGAEFDGDYYLRGPETGKSNYTNYSWRPELTIPVCKLIMRYLGAQKGDSVCDWGCGLGFYVKALQGLGFNAVGYDVSEWAIENCDPDVKRLVWSRPAPQTAAMAVDYILCKDVLEHIERSELGGVINGFLEMTVKSALIIVPLGAMPHGQAADGTERAYVSPVDRMDATHRICWTLDEWLRFIQGVIDASGRAFTISGSYKMPGVKKAADPYPYSCGFFLLKRFEYA